MFHFIILRRLSVPFKAPQKRIQVSDRAILFKLLIGLEGYTISAGILNGELDGVEIVQGPLDVEDMIKVGWRPIKKQSSAAWPSSTLKNSIIQYV